MRKVYTEIYYEEDSVVHGLPDYWQSPKETLDRGTGDCEDLSILLAKLIFDETGYQAEVVTGSNGKGAHAWLLFKGRHYDVTRGRMADIDELMEEYNVIKYYPYRKALGKCAVFMI
jgi:hypothetical protein